MKQEEPGKSIKISPKTHELLWLYWKDKDMGIRAQIAELVRNSRKYDKYRKEAQNE